jgi:hypothetical protein
MKYIILILGIIIIALIGKYKDLLGTTGMGAGVGCIFIMFVEMVWVVVWLVVFYVFDLQLPKITI